MGLSISLVGALTAFIGLWFFADSLLGFIGCVILLDAGVQAGAVSNQARIYAVVAIGSKASEYSLHDLLFRRRRTWRRIRRLRVGNPRMVGRLSGCHCDAAACYRLAFRQ